MSPSASAAWPLKAAGVLLFATGAAVLLASLAALIALTGLGVLSPDIDPAAVPAWLWHYRHDPEVRRWTSIGALAAAAIGAVGVFAALQGRRPPLHGAARWASEAELRRSGLRTKTGIVLGRKGGRLLVFGGPEHVMLYAPTRTGKGVGVVIPNLLTWPDSVVVLDVKRENWAASAGFRAAHGQKVLLFDPLDPAGRTARFNPLGHIDRTDPVSVLDELHKLAVMLFPTPENVDPFWSEAARIGFIGVGALLAETPEASFSLGALYTELTKGDPRTRLPEILTARRNAARPVSASCASAIGDFCSASENTFASVKQTITSRMGLWLNPRVAAATEVSDFDLRDLRSRRISLYLAVSPDNLLRVAPLYNLLLQQLVDLNTRELPDPERQCVPVLLLLDEFARLGNAQMIARGFSYLAGYGLRLLPVLQSPAQLRAQYGPDLAEEIIANCGAEIAFAPKELKVAQDLSERLGFWTYPGRSKSRPSLLSKGVHTLTESDQRRPLMMAQELIQMPPEDLIVLRAGVPPVRGRKIVYWKERAFAARVRPPPAVPPHPGVGEPSVSKPSGVAATDQALSAQERTHHDLASGPGRQPGRLRPKSRAPRSQEITDTEAQLWIESFLDAPHRSRPSGDRHG